MVVLIEPERTKTILISIGIRFLFIEFRFIDKFHVPLVCKIKFVFSPQTETTEIQLPFFCVYECLCLCIY